ncbi:MAG: pyridoxamine 5-phosphate oxidase-related FMN-binding [Pseudonocardiales bacterium]|nr:pyridoxamine 5-phosphate oxidase-related FMN-binding [Pseudonocardiales bacterium]
MTEPSEPPVVPGTRPQKRGRTIAMTPAEIDAFLAAERTCRLATVRADGSPHVSPLWFVWCDQSLWITSIVKSQRWTDVQREPRVSAVIDGGVTFAELRGVEINGRAEVVGDVPRTTQRVGELVEPEHLMARKYNDRDDYVPDGRHAWLRIRPTKIVSWDFTKSPRLQGRSES